MVGPIGERTSELGSLKAKKILLAIDDPCFSRTTADCIAISLGRKIAPDIIQTNTLEDAERILQRERMDLIVTGMVLYPTNRLCRINYLGDHAEGMNAGAQLVADLRASENWQTPSLTNVIVLNTLSARDALKPVDLFSTPGVKIVGIPTLEAEEILSAVQEGLTASFINPQSYIN